MILFPAFTEAVASLINNHTMKWMLELDLIKMSSLTPNPNYDFSKTEGM